MNAPQHPAIAAGKPLPGSGTHGLQTRLIRTHVWGRSVSPNALVSNVVTNVVTKIVTKIVTRVVRHRVRKIAKHIIARSREALVLNGTASLLTRSCLRWLLLCKPELRAMWREQCRCLSVFLHEPLRGVTRLLWRHGDYQRRVEFRRNHPLSAARLRTHVNNIQFPARDAYLRLAHSAPGSRLLTTFHFGDYSYGLNALLACEPPGRAVHVLSLAPGSAGYRTNIRQAFGPRAAGLTAELLHADHSVPSLSALLRRGNSTLVLFCDLPEECGERTAVTFLGRRAWFSRGPATLAVVNRVPLFPVLCCSDGDRQWIDMAAPLDPTPEPHEDLRSCVDRLTQQLVTYFEVYFRAAPEQWRYLHRLPLYFANTSLTPSQI